MFKSSINTSEIESYFPYFSILTCFFEEKILIPLVKTNQAEQKRDLGVHSSLPKCAIFSIDIPCILDLPTRGLGDV